MSQSAVLGETCNFSATGRTRRLQVGWSALVVTVVSFVGVVLFHAHPALRALVGLPAMTTAITLLQVRRNTCVKHAGSGTFEHEDFKTSSLDPAIADKHRAVAATIFRDGVLIGVVVAALAAATGLTG